MQPFRFRLLPRFLFAGALLALVCGSASPLSAQASRKGKAAKAPSPTPTPAPAKAGPDASGALPDVVAVVDGEPVKRDELERVFTTMLSANGRNLSELSPADQKRGYRSVLDGIITDKIISRLAAGEKVEDIDIEKHYNALRDTFKTPDAYTAELKKSGRTVEQVRAAITTQLQQQKWIQGKIADQIKVTPEEVDKYYKDNPDRFDVPEMVKASHIMLAVRKDAPPEVALEKEKLAADLAARAKKGEAFDALAKQYSDDPNAKQTGGDLDYFSRDRIMPEFAAAAFKLKVGEISAPVRTQFGYHVIKVTDHKDPRIAKLDEARPQVLAYLQSVKKQDAINKLLQSVRDNAKVENRLE